MYLDNLIKDIEGIPVFSYYIKDDYNPQSGHHKRRVIWIPNDVAREVHERLIHYLTCELREHFSSYGTSCLKGCSYVENALLHLGSRYFYLLDLESAYPTMTSEMASHVLCSMDKRLYNRERSVASFLARHCFLCPPMIASCQELGYSIESDDPLIEKEIGGLITGAPASPALFNLVAGNLIDKPLVELLDQKVGYNRWVYSRYTDDLTISFPSYHIEDNKPIRAAIRAVIKEAGFDISHHKSRVMDIARGAVSITGTQLVYDERGNYIKLSTPYLEKIRHILYLALRPESTIDFQRVNGYWGAFVASLKRRKVPLSNLEKDIFRLYRVWVKTQKTSVEIESSKGIRKKMHDLMRAKSWTTKADNPR